MKRQEFDEIARRIAARYEGRPEALERATARWIRFGLAGLCAWLVLLVALGLSFFAAGIVLEPPAGVALLVIGVLILAYALFQAGYILLVESPRPEGRVLRPGEAPALAAMLDRLRADLGCRPFSEVRITMQFNAGVREVPRLGLLGWLRSTLEIGLPLGLSMPTEELRAVLAHEFAHLSSGHGRGGNRIYRLHRTWCNLMEAMSRKAGGAMHRSVRGVLARFLDWYWPRLHARAMVLSRMQEFHADRVAAALVGPGTLASALWRIECLNGWFADRFWTDLHGQAETLPDPPADVFDRMRRGLLAPVSPEDAAPWIERALSRATDHEDTHPAFPDRAQALGGPPGGPVGRCFPEPVSPSAAEALLGADLGAIEKDLAEEWRRSVRAAWRERCRLAASRARRQAPAEPAPDDGAAPLADVHALWESAREAASLRGPAAAEPLLRAVLERDPAHAGASVMLGHSRLRLGDAEGEALLLKVVERGDEAWMHPACGVLEEHYRATGQTERLRLLRARLDEHEAAIEGARRERSEIRAGDRFHPHDLPEPQLEPLRKLLGSLPDCTGAWLARKELRYFPHRPLFVLCVRAGGSWWSPGRSDRERELVRRLSTRVELPGQVLVIARRGRFRGIAAKVMATPGAAVAFRAEDYSAAGPSAAS